MNEVPGDGLGDNLWRAAEALRLGIQGVANEHLVDVVAGLEQRMAGDPHLRNSQAVQFAIQLILEGQQRGDDLLIADLLEFELAPRLGLGRRG